MSSEPLSEGIMDVHDRLVAEARAEGAEEQRKRSLVVLSLAESEAMDRGDSSSVTVLRDCYGAIKSTAPVPPAKGPMTIEKLIQRLQERGCVLPNLEDWTYTKLDLILLVKAQARRDAEIARGMAPVPLYTGGGGEALVGIALAIHNRIIREAGLK